MPVVNIHHQPGNNYVYIGRLRHGMHFGNPFIIKFNRTRLQAVVQFEDWLKGRNHKNVEPERRQWILNNLSSLKGKNLGCFCAPAACHGDVLEKLANATTLSPV